METDLYEEKRMEKDFYGEYGEDGEVSAPNTDFRLPNPADALLQTL